MSTSPRIGILATPGPVRHCGTIRRRRVHLWSWHTLMSDGLIRIKPGKCRKPAISMVMAVAGCRSCSEQQPICTIFKPTPAAPQSHRHPRPGRSQKRRIGLRPAHRARRPRRLQADQARAVSATSPCSANSHSTAQRTSHPWHAVEGRQLTRGRPLWHDHTNTERPRSRQQDRCRHDLPAASPVDSLTGNPCLLTRG